MAKKNEVQGDEFVPETVQQNAGFTPGEEGSIGIDSDFNIDDEWKPTPLVPNGTYHGAVTDVKFDVENQAIQWTVVLNDNGGIMNDNETSVDGSQHFFRNWLPKPGDETIPDKSGKGTKRQAKINMLKQFADNMKLNMVTSKAIAQAIINKEWVGLSVDVKISIDEYEGRFRNQIDRMVQK